LGKNEQGKQPAVYVVETGKASSLSLSRLPRTLHVRAKTTPSSTPGAHTFIKDEGVDAGKGVYTGTGQANTTFFFLTSTVRID
jgi:hypothetical protein